ncbi:MAG: hypothetical protein ACI8W8_003786 [Rhodothermales bacterium]
MLSGSIGKWGQVEMPPQAHLQDGERDLLARWVLGLKASGEKLPHLGPAETWKQYQYYGQGPVSVSWDAASMSLGLQKAAGGPVEGFHRERLRTPQETVGLTVRDVQAAGKPWGQVGLMISAKPRPSLLGSGAKYEWIVRRETGGAGWDYRVRKDVGTENYELYSSAPVDPKETVRLEIVRVGENYEFRANGTLHYTTGDNPQDSYKLAIKDALEHCAVTFGGSGAMSATLVDFNDGESLTTANLETAPVAAPSGDGLFIERYKGYVIEIADVPLVYRGYLHGIPSRAIAVGLPSKVSYAFDAAGCRLVYAWRGGFLDAQGAWGGTFGGWYSKLLGAKFYTAPEGFPLRIGDPDKEPTLQFKGYDIDKHLPVFKYLVDGQPVRHRINVSDDGKTIQHAFALPGNKKPTYYLGDKDAFASPDAEWKDGRWAVRADKSGGFAVEVVK